VVVVPEPAPARRSSLGVILPLAILALLVGVAVSRDDDDDEDDDDDVAAAPPPVVDAPAT
jgi:hypothetical protein